MMWDEQWHHQWCHDDLVDWRGRSGPIKWYGDDVSSLKNQVSCGLAYNWAQDLYIKDRLDTLATTPQLNFDN